MEKLYSLEDIMKMKKEERKEKIKDINISKQEFITTILTSKKFKKLPGKTMLVKEIGKMSEEKFKDFVTQQILNL